MTKHPRRQGSRARRLVLTLLLVGVGAFQLSAPSSPWQLFSATARVHAQEPARQLRVDAPVRLVTANLTPAWAHGDLLDQPPSPPANYYEHVHPKTTDELAQPAAIGTRPVAASAETELSQPQIPSDFIIRRDSAFATGPFGAQSDVGEPSVGSIQDTLFQSGNWYAARSTNNGASWSFVNPYSTFPTTPSPYSAGFCCDQRVAQDASRGLIFWYLQYVKTGSTTADTGPTRLAVGNTAGVAANTWWYYDLTPVSFGLAPGLWFDFPHMDIGSNYLYFTTNIFRTDTNGYYGAMIARIPLAQLASNSAITANAAIYLATFGSITTVNGMTTTGYFASTFNANTVAVIQWPEAMSSPLAASFVTTSGSTFFTTFACVGPDGRDPCTRAGTRMQSGWVNATELGLMWTSGQNSASGRPYPFTRVLILGSATPTTVISDTDLWNSSTALLYPAVAVNARGHQGGILDVLGGAYYPTPVALIRDDYTGGAWGTLTIVGSTYGTAGRWGDYNGATFHTKYPNTWLVAGHVQTAVPTGQNATGHNTWVMRERDSPSAPLTVTSLTASPALPVVAGTTVTWTAAATGGTAPYTYRFLVNDGASWTVGQEWSASNTFAWTPFAPGSYTLQVWVRNAGSVTLYDAWLGVSGSVLAPTVLTVTGVTPSAPATAAGSPVTWIAYTAGGTGPYTYKFYVFDGNAWRVGQDWSGTNTWVWTPPRAGTYVFQVWVRNAGSTAVLDAWRPFGPFSASVPGALTVTEVTSDLSTAPAGTPVTWSTTAEGGTGPYTYRFWVFNGSTWSIGQDWSAAASWSWVPPSAGSYSFQVWARNAGSAADYDAWRGGGPFSAGAAATLAVTGLASDRAASVAAGTPVRWTATAAGGAGPYTYKFYLYNGALWLLGQDWSPSNTWDWVPGTPGTYYPQVWVRNAGSASAYDAWAGTGATSVTAPTGLSVASFTMSPLSPAFVAGPVTLAATASGGTGPYMYKFYVYNGSSWAIAQDWSASPSVNWTPPTAGTYQFQVWIRNSGSAAVFDAWAPFGPVIVGP